MLLQLKRVSHTYGFLYANFKTLEIKSMYFQFSLKDPWLIPHYESESGKSKTPLFGWLFFYVGIATEALLCPVVKEDLPFVGKVIEDKTGTLYYTATTDKTIIQKHKKYINHGSLPKAHYNRFSNTATYYN